MKVRQLLSKRVVAAGLAAGIALGGGGAAFAYFTQSGGTGTGSGQTGSAPVAVSISEIGAGYDSLNSANIYTQDQCMQGCSGPSEIGDAVTLANGGDQQLTSVVMAVNNWGPAVTGASLTVQINNTVAGPVSYTQTFDIPQATINGTQPSTTNVTFNLASEGIFVQQSFVYGITYGDPDGDPATQAQGCGRGFNGTGGCDDPAGESNLNIALTSESTDVSVGSDTNPGMLYLDDSNPNNNDFPTCDNSALPTTGFVQINTSCGMWNPADPGAYGDEGAESQNIPAIEFNVVGGVAASLYPGGPTEPVDLAITNPNAGPVYVGDVDVTITGVTTPPANANEACAPTMYQLNDSAGNNVSPAVDAINHTVPSGTTLEIPSGVTIQMNDDGHNQDNCEAPYGVVALKFQTNP